jgi:hypothetical protein
MLKKENYSFLSRTLHHLILGNNFILEMLHDLEASIYKNKINNNKLKKHIFICGLARSGTTILMKSLYETNEFASLTYRDMPFIILPNLWSKISSRIKKGEDKIRAHNDRILVNIDSPEALDEIFWRVKLQHQYIFPNKLLVHKVDEFTINEYINFISLILYKYKKEFYISKNNNNLLRIESIAEAFPNSLFLVPFRDPFQQSYSLLTQHKNFINLQTEDKFVKNYMTYLVHHEFGIDHRPYDFGTKNKIETNRDSIEYWLEQWINAYEYISQEKFIKNKNIVYINYENLCKNPQKIFDYISKRINLDGLLLKNNHKFEISYKNITTPKSIISSKAKDIFEKLKTLSNNIF